MTDLAEILKELSEELRDLKKEGVETLYIQDQTLDSLSGLLNKNSPKPEDSNSSSPVKAKSSLISERLKPESKPTENTKSSKSNLNSELLPSPKDFELPEGEREFQWRWLKKRVLDCDICNKQLKPGKKLVFGTGNLEADLFLCGEAPGAEEEEEGLPFVGRAGQKLNDILSAMNISRDQVYISNIVNFRPPHEMKLGNRPPRPDEIKFCLPYLEAQIDIVKPRVILALGKTAATGLIGPDKVSNMKAVRGKWWNFKDTPLLVTYHPSYLLHRENDLGPKRAVWEDMLMIMERLEIPISQKQKLYFTPKH